MKNIITLSNEQAQVLYVLLSQIKLESKENKARYKFLQVIEDDVFDYEDKLDKIREVIPVLGKDALTAELEAQREAVQIGNTKIRELQKKTKQYTFNDREVYAEIRTMFINKAGKDLEGKTGRIYEEIDQAFVDVKEVNDEKKKK